MEYFENWPYFAWGLGAATTFFLVTSFATSFLHPDKKAHLSLWLQGDYESTWAQQFGLMFDRIFGEKHHYPRCILISAIASVIAVLALWLLFDRILGLISLRADTGLSLTQALLLGAAINIIPDYISLYETRWLLKQFERITNPVGQLAVLIVDAAVTGLIIYLGIKGYLWITGAPQISVVEMMALFSIYAVFFYSTFLTSIWAWAYCLSSWLSRISAGLRNWLDVGGAHPGRALALLGAGFVLIGSLIAKPALTIDETGRIAMDDFLCEMFPASACTHVARLTEDEEEKLKYLANACKGGDIEQCHGTAWNLREVNPTEAAVLWSKSCDTGNPSGCANLGVLYGGGLGVQKDTDRAKQLYERACSENIASACSNLASYYEKGISVSQDLQTAAGLAQKGCDGGNPVGCVTLGLLKSSGQIGEPDHTSANALFLKACNEGNVSGCANMGTSYHNGRGVAQDFDKARRFHQLACDGDDLHGCMNLGKVYSLGLGVSPDLQRANAIWKDACERGNAQSCTNLGLNFGAGFGVEANATEAIRLLTLGCNGDSADGCSNLGIYYFNGDGVEQDYSKARELFEKGCDRGNAAGCVNLGFIYEGGRGIDQDFARARSLFKQACDGGQGDGCSRLGRQYLLGEHVEKDLPKARQIFIEACRLEDPAGCAIIGAFYRDGIGGSTDLAKAVKAFKFACDGGVTQTCDEPSIQENAE